jgi:uncharacterized protein (TIGR02145 family)
MFLITKISTPKRSTNMKTNKRFLVAAISIALAFTFPGCSSDSGGGEHSSSSSAPAEPPAPKCGGEEYDPATQFCDERDGNIYKWKLIEGTGGYSKVWMAENLSYAADGSKCVAAGTSASGTLVDEGGRCGTYGRLYNWATAMDNAASSDATPSGVQGVCPEGWHLPSDAEWTALKTVVGTDPGKKLKASSSLWSTNAGTDDYGFSALPGGNGGSSGSFGSVGRFGLWWSVFAGMGGSLSDVGRDYNDKSTYNSVRCLQN